MVHKFQKGDRVAVYIDLFKGYVPAIVTSVNNNLLNIQTLPKKQGFTITEDDAQLVSAGPRIKIGKQVIRYSRF